MRKLATELNCKTIEWIDWIDYEHLPDEIHGADICLGIFGETDKAARVIPNKVFQVVACGRPLVTADTPPVRDFLGDAPNVRLVPPGDDVGLLDAIEDLLRDDTDTASDTARTELARRTRPAVTARGLAERLVTIGR